MLIKITLSVILYGDTCIIYNVTAVETTFDMSAEQLILT